MNDVKHGLLAIFTEAIALESDEERSNYLNEACRNDPSARARVEAQPFVAIFAVIDCMFADSVGCILSCHFTKRFERNGVTRWF